MAAELLAVGHEFRVSCPGSLFFQCLELMVFGNNVAETFAETEK
jgi:hypothetical protein